MFSIVLSLVFIFFPLVSKGPSGGFDLDAAKPSAKNTKSVEMAGQQTPGQKQEALPRSEPFAPRKKEGSKSLGIETTAKSALVFDAGTGTILFDKNSREKTSLASLTKLMTALVFLDEKIDWGTTIKMTYSDDREGGIVYARAPEEVTVEDLFKTMLVGSINNAAVALARSTGLTEAEFVEKMNVKAKEIGLTNTVFADPTGLLPDNQGTARDIAKLLKAALDREEIRGTVNQKVYIFSPQKSKKVYYVKSTDELLWSFMNEVPYTFLGGKTGYIEESGYNLAVEAERDGHKVIAVVLGSASAEERFKEVKGLVDWTFENYNW